MSHNKPVALITGVSTGIGRAATVALAAGGFEVVISYNRNAEMAAQSALGDRLR